MYWIRLGRRYLESALVLCEYTQILLGLIKFGFSLSSPNTKYKINIPV